MIRYLTPVSSRAGLVGAVYVQIERDFGLVAEPFALHAAVPELLAAAWATLRETVIADGFLPRGAKEAMAMAVSRGDRCPYCADAHAIMLHATGDGAVERAIHRGRAEGIGDRQLAALLRWAAATNDPAAPIVATPPFTAREAPEAIGTVLCFKYVNRLATVLLGETPLPSRSRWLRRPILRTAGRQLAPRARRAHPPGESLRLLPDAEPAPHLRWAAPAPAITAAFARFEAAVERAAAPVLAPATRTRLLARLARWRGDVPPFGDDWLGEELAGLPPAQGAAARLALLAALAPHRAHEAEVAAFRAHWPGDEALLAVLAWGSFHAARTISEWLGVGSC